MNTKQTDDATFEQAILAADKAFEEYLNQNPTYDSYYLVSSPGQSKQGYMTCDDPDMTYE
jgi:hypothetical protein